MRRLAIVLVVALCGSAAEATERKRGHGDGRMYRPGLFGGNAAAASLLENPLACTTVIVAGQSLGDGVCSGGTCAAQSVTPQQDFMLDNDEVELCALREGGGGASCGQWSDKETVLSGVINTWRGLRGGTVPSAPAFIGTHGAVSGSNIASWAAGQANHTKIVNQVTIIDGLLSDLETGCTEQVVRAVVWIHGEADDDGTDNNYDGQLEAIMTAYCTSVQGITGQTACPIWLIAQTSSWGQDGPSTRDPESATQQLNVCDNRSDAYCFAPEYYYTYETNNPWAHLQAPSYTALGSKAGALAFQILEQAEDFDGVQLASATVSGTNVTACFNTHTNPLVLDTTTCPAHWNGDYGLEWYQDEINSPAITSVAVTSPTNCLLVGFDRTIQDWSTGRFRVGWSNNGPTVCGGCTCDGLTYANLRDSDATAPLAAGNAYNWAMTDQIDPTGGAAASAHTASHFIRLDATNEYVTIPDDNSLDFTSQMTIAFRRRRHSNVDNMTMAQKGGTATWRISDFINVTPRYWITWYVGGTTNNVRSDGPGDLLPEVWYSIVMTYNAGVAHIYFDCIEQDQVVGGTLPATIPVDTNPVRWNNTANIPEQDIAWMAVWNTALTEAQIEPLCRATVSLTGFSPTPVSAWEPDENDSELITGGLRDKVGSNHGTLTNTEQDDIRCGWPDGGTCSADAG